MKPMHRISIAAAAVCLWGGVGAGAVEGYNNLPADIRDKMGSLSYSLVLGGAKAKDIAQAINDWKVINIEVDSNLQNRTVREYKLEMGSAADHADALAKALNVKAWAVRTGIFIGAKVLARHCNDFEQKVIGSKRLGELEYGKPRLGHGQAPGESGSSRSRAQRVHGRG